MTEVQVTAIDRAHAAMIGGGETELWRFYETLARAELLVLLEAGEAAEPREPKVVPVQEAQYVLVFDLAERVFELTGYDAPTSQVTGLDLFNLLRGRGIGVGVNMGEAPSAMLIPSDAIDLICETFEERADAPPVPVATAGNFRALLAPKNFPDTVFLALNEKLGRVSMFFDKALLLQAEYEDGQSGYLVAFSDSKDAGRGAVAEAVNEAIASSGRRDVVLDIAFLAGDEPLLERISRVATALSPAPNSWQPGNGPKPVIGRRPVRRLTLR